MGLIFSWDEAKAASNQRKHKVSFAEAQTIFGDPLLQTVVDWRHSGEEMRFFSLGRAKSGRLIAVAHTDEGNQIRLISARVATAAERRGYEKEG